tara:strand:+ start:829 stop:1140 length:312 start_codon:yes stop_codon:yes gene_type:complete
MRAYEQSRANLPHRIAARKAYAQTARGKERLTAGNKAWRGRNPEKYKAQYILGNAVRAGKIVRQPCAICGEPKAHAHHADYNKPLEVEWLCAEHHRAWHKEHG